MWPIIHRELCAAMRDPAVRAIRMWVPVAGAAITALFLLVAMADRVTAGRMLLWMLTWGVMAMGLAQGGRLAMSAFAEDREQGTLGLLFLCGLKAHEVFVARVAGQAIVFCQVLLSVAPLLVVPVFLGGVSSDALLGIWSLLPSFLLLVMSIAVFAGLVCREPGEANILCLLLLIGSLGLGPGMHMLRQILVGDGRFAGLAWLGPFKGLTSLPREDWNLPWEELWISVGSTLAMVVLFLVCALWRVGRIWKQEIFNGGADSWGNLGRRQAQPTTLVPVDESPYAWRLFIEGGERRSGRVLIAGAFGGWLLGLLAGGGAWLTTGVALLCGWLFVAVVSDWTSARVAREVAHDRIGGTFEHLLVTPLGVESILEGCACATRLQAKQLRRAAVGLCLFWALLPVPWRDWNGWAAAEYAILWALLIANILANSGRTSFESVWRALNTGRLGRAPSLFSWILLIFVLSRVVSASGGVAPATGNPFPSGSGHDAALAVSAALLFGLSALLGRIVSDSLEARRRLLEHFREIASAPLPERRSFMLGKWDGRRPLVPRNWTRRVGYTFSGTTNGSR